MSNDLILFDIDGTLADVTHRVNYVRTKPTNWKAFNAAAKLDPVIPIVLEIYHMFLKAGKTLLLGTGRIEDLRVDTEDWLERNGVRGYIKMYMRPENDFRPDTIIKREMLDLIENDFGKWPDAVFDDRPGVVQMWKDVGIFVFDVSQNSWVGQSE